MCNCRWRHENLRAVRQTVRPKGLLDGLWYCSKAKKIKISSEGQATCRLQRKSPKEYRYNESSRWNAGITSLSPAVGRTLTNRLWASFHDENVSPFRLRLSSYSFSTESSANLYFKITWRGRGGYYKDKRQLTLCRNVADPVRLWAGIESDLSAQNRPDPDST